MDIVCRIRHKDDGKESEDKENEPQTSMVDNETSCHAAARDARSVADRTSEAPKHVKECTTNPKSILRHQKPETSIPVCGPDELKDFCSEGRVFIVDSGTSVNVINQEDARKEFPELVRSLKERLTFDTANGKQRQTKESASKWDSGHQRPMLYCSSKVQTLCQWEWHALRMNSHSSG